MHTLSHTQEGLEVVWVMVRGILLLLEHHLRLSVVSLESNSTIPTIEHQTFTAVVT